MKDKEPKDLGVKVGSKNQVIWESVKKEALSLIESSEQHLVVQRAMLELADNKILEEKEKFK